MCSTGNVEHTCVHVCSLTPWLGSSGALPNNVHRDLLTRLPKSAMPEPDRFLVDLHHSVTGYYEAAIDMLLPHAMFSHIYHFYRESFFEYIVPDGGAISSFWRSVRGASLHMTWHLNVQHGVMI